MRMTIWRALTTLLLISSLVTSALASEGTPVTQTLVAVATTSTAVAPAFVRKSRTLLVVQNDSDTTVYCNVSGKAAVVGEGIRLSSSGGAVFFDIVVPQQAVTCIHGGSGNKNVTVTQGTPSGVDN